MCKLYCKPCATEFDGTPCAVKAARTVWSRGKVGDYIKDLPMAIRQQESGHEAAHGWRRRCSGGHHPDSSAVWSVRLRAAGGVSRLYIRNRSISAVDNSPLIRSALQYESPPISERRCYYAVFDPHYFSLESAQDPHQPLQLRTVTAEWKPFSRPLPTGSKAS